SQDAAFRLHRKVQARSQMRITETAQPVFSDAVRPVVPLWKSLRAVRLAPHSDEHRILVLVSRRARAKKNKRLASGIQDAVHRPRRDGDGIKRPDALHLVIDRHFALASENIVNLLSLEMIMRRGAIARRDAGFSQTLVADAGISVRQ